MDLKKMSFSQAPMTPTQAPISSCAQCCDSSRTTGRGSVSHMGNLARHEWLGLAHDEIGVWVGHIGVWEEIIAPRLHCQGKNKL
jgi:hypothetical protein